MALAALSRPGRWLRGLGPGRGHWTAAWRSRSRREAAEAEADAPVFQYVGERAARVDRIFVWGFSFSGALGVPTFVLPGSGPEPRAGLRPRRRIQPVPYRLELDQKVRAATPLFPLPWHAPGPLGGVSGTGWSHFRRTTPERAVGPGGEGGGAAADIHREAELCQRWGPARVIRPSPREAGLSPQLDRRKGRPHSG